MCVCVCYKVKSADISIMNLIQFDINVYYINLYICRLHFITYI